MVQGFQQCPGGGVIIRMSYCHSVLAGLYRCMKQGAAAARSGVGCINTVNVDLDDRTIFPLGITLTRGVPRKPLSE
jgi:hypothetical protein